MLLHKVTENSRTWIFPRLCCCIWWIIFFIYMVSLKQHSRLLIHMSLPNLWNISHPQSRLSPLWTSDKFTDHHQPPPAPPSKDSSGHRIQAEIWATSHVWMLGRVRYGYVGDIHLEHEEFQGDMYEKVEWNLITFDYTIILTKHILGNFLGGESLGSRK